MFFTQQNLGQSYGNAPGMMRYLSFAIAFNDSGSGAVNTTPDYNLGSGTATYTRNTTAYALLSNGNYGSVASGTARGSYNASGTWLGYQAEGARADVLGTTNAIRRTMTDVGWVATTMTVGAATGIDGVASAGASLTATAGNATILFTTVLGAAVRTFSAWVRRKTGTGTVNITGDNGVTWTAMTLTTTYKQFQFTTASAANPVVGFRIVTDTDAIEVDFNTLEVAAFANPTPIPVNVSKADDVLSYPLTGNISSTVGTIYAEYLITVGTGGRLVQDADGNTWPLVNNGTATKVEITDFTNTAVVAVSGSQTTVNKAASFWGGTAIGVVQNGGAVATSGFVGTLSLANAMLIGNAGAGGASIFGTIRNLKIFSQPLSALQITVLTT